MQGFGNKLVTWPYFCILADLKDLVPFQYACFQAFVPHREAIAL